MHSEITARWQEFSLARSKISLASMLLNNRNFIISSYDHFANNVSIICFAR